MPLKWPKLYLKVSNESEELRELLVLETVDFQIKMKNKGGLDTMNMDSIQGDPFYC